MYHTVHRTRVSAPHSREIRPWYAGLAEWNLTLKADGHELEYVFDSNAERTGVPSLMRRLSDLGIGFKDLNTRQSSLEEIFVSLVHDESRAVSKEARA